MGTESAIGSETDLDTLKSPAVQSKEVKSKRRAHNMSLWKHDREGWKYNKDTQNGFCDTCVNQIKLTFEILSEYINDLQGKRTLHCLIKNRAQEDQTDET